MWTQYLAFHVCTTNYKRCADAKGFWGLIISAVALPILSFVNGGDGLPLDNAAEALRQIAGSWQLQLSTALSVFSIAWFNFFGVGASTHVHRT